MSNRLKSIVVLEADTESLFATMATSHYTKATLHQSGCLKETQKIVKKQKPNLAIIDLCLVDGQVHEFIKALRTSSPETTCIVASYIEEDKDIFQALKAGAKGYLLKDKEQDQILKHLVNILDGQPTVAPAIAYQMLGYFHQQPNFDNDVQLSNRESEILKLIASGHKRAEVAEVLNITLNTVATHLKTV